MKHLRATFDEELSNEENLYVEKGQVYIRERHWAPQELLEALGAATYEDMFKNWLAEHRNERLYQADTILDAYDQGERFSMLKAAFKRGAVMPFVGAGLSIPSGYPGWTEFLRSLRRQTRVPEDKFKRLLDNGAYEDVAQALADELGIGFNEEIENRFGCERDLHGPVQLLPYVFPTAVVTTNFDDVLKRCYENANRPFADTIPGVQAEELLRYLGAGRAVLLKLHGRSTTRFGRVLTSREYDAAYGQQGLLIHVVPVICSRTLLFLGCSLNIDRLLSAIASFVGNDGHDRLPRHYAFLSAPVDDDRRIRRRSELARFNIYPIWYPDGEHDESIEALLFKLVEGIVELC